MKRINCLGWIIALLAILTVLPALGQLDDGSWPMFRHDPQHTGRSPYMGPDRPVLKWSYVTGSPVSSSPAIGVDGTIYVGADDYNLYALNPDGTLKWSYPTRLEVYSSPAIGVDGTIYVGSLDSNFYAINSDGTFKWSYSTGGNLSSPVIGDDGTVCVGSNDYKVYALNPDGTLKWSYLTGSYVCSSPAIGFDGTIYAGSYDYNVYALNPDGSLKWSYPTSSYVYSSPAIGVDGTIYVGSLDSKLYALNPDGTLKWSYSTSSFISSSPAIGVDGTIYVGADDYNLYVLNPDGTLKWKYSIEGDVNGLAIDIDGTIYVSTKGHKLYALNPDGTLKWIYNAGGYIYSSPAIGADGTVYVGSSEGPYGGGIYAIGHAFGCEFTHFPGWVPRTGTLNFAMTWTNNLEDPVTVDGQFEFWRGDELKKTIPYDSFNLPPGPRTCNFVLGPVQDNAPLGVYTIINKFTADGDACQCEEEFEVAPVGWVE